MVQKATNSEKPVTKSRESQSGNGLPVPIHPDDAKDKVFTAILKALLKMGNKPSSPKELANIIVKYKYATLGGATPFATVSSRISQHFKRAAEHNPPRAPLLAKHIDQKHSRKINYSLATESVSNKEEQVIEEEQEEEEDIPDPTRTNSKTRRTPISKRSYVNNDNDHEHPLKKHKPTHIEQPTSSISPPTLANPSDEESEGELSDYHEEMLKGDLGLTTGRKLARRKSSIARSLASKPNTQSDTNTSIDPLTTSSSSDTITPVRKPSFSFNSGFPGEQELWTPFSFEHDFDNVILHDSSTVHNIPFNIATPESISVNELDDYFATPPSTNRSQRKSFSSSMLGPNDKSLLQKVLLASAARGVADKSEEDKLETIVETAAEEEADSSKDPTSETVSQPDKPAETLNSASLMDVTNGEDFVKFEEDEKKETPTSTQQQRKVTEILPATPVSAAEILKSMNIQNLNLSALQQVNNNTPAPTFDLAKTMAAYMQSLAKSASTNSSPASSTHAMDLKSILQRFPVLEAFIKKETPSPPTTSTSEFVPNLVTPSFTAGSTEPIVHTLTAMSPPMYITLIDHIAVCIVVLAKTETTPEYRIMRRMDTGFINGTVLLTAGGIETESERSMILSFEMERVRMPKKKSPLFGTWIPLRRAQELAVTCSIQNKLGHFLEDAIEQYFPSPLPIQITPRKPTRDGRLTALALAALRSDVNKTNEFVVPPISRQSSSSSNLSALSELLMTHPHKALKSNGTLSEKAPLLSNHKEKDPLSTLKPTATTRQHSSTSSSNSSSRNHASSEKDESDVDIVNSSDSSSSSSSSSNEEESEGDEEQHEAVKPKLLNLEEVLSRVAVKQPLHVHPRDLQKKRRRQSIEEESKTPSKASTTARKKPSTNTNNHKSGKNASVAIKRSASGTGTTITIKRPTSSSTTGKKTNAKSATKKEEEVMDNVVVKHEVTPVTKPTSPVETKKPTAPVSEDEEDDEDIDIGGSDCDDDLR